MPQKNDYTVAIIGAGPGGICAGIKLREAGIDDFVIVEKAAGVGGTWWHNRYPGAECDVASHLYSFSFAPKRDWSRPYARQPEILEYMQSVVAAYGLEPWIRCNTEVGAAHWQETSNTWRLDLVDDEPIECRFLISGVGMFTAHQYPDVPGRDRFEGTQFHTADWPREHDFTDERVGVIGTAASAVQMIPEIAGDVGELHVFQRRPQWVLPKEDEPFSHDEIESFVNDDAVVAAERARIRQNLEAFITFSDPEVLERAETAGLRNLEVVDDPVVRAKLTPDMAYGCRRPLASNLYYPVFNRPNVDLETRAIEAITAHGVRIADEEIALDTIIYATGFQTTRYLSCIDVFGVDGLSIHDAWADGAQAMLGITTAGFPNLFMLYGPNTNNGSILEMLEHQVDYSIARIQQLMARGATRIELTGSAMATYNDRLQQDLDRIGVWQGACGGYYRAAGGFIVTQWPHTMDEYQAYLDADLEAADRFEIA